MTSFLDTTTTSSMMANTTLTAPETSRSNQLLTSQLRTATMVLTSFNILAALCTGFSILCDARKVHKRRRGSREGELGVTEEGGGRGGRGGAGGCEKREGDSGGGGARGTTWGDLRTNDNDDGEIKERGNWWTNIPAAGVFPLALAVAIVVQGIMLMYVESKGLDGKSVLGSCEASSEVTWTALWIPPFTVLSFGLDVCIRTISQPRFRPRPPRSLLYCIAFTLVLTILTWIPSRISTINASREQDICVGSLTSYVKQFSTVALAILCTIIPLVAVLGGIIFRQLSRSVAMEYEQRISASRVVSFMFINIVQWILIIPYFAYMAPGTHEVSLAFLATVIINISGITAHILHLYFRANTKAALIGPKNAYHNNSDGELLVDQLQAKDTEASPTVLYNAKEVQIRDIQQKQQGFSSKPDQNGAIRVSSSSANSGDHPRQSPFSRQTMSSFRRLSEEITALLAGIRTTAGTSPNANNSPPHTPSSKYSSPSLKSSNSPNYLLFPPSAETERYREWDRVALGTPTPTINIQYISTSAENTLKFPSPSRANTFKQPQQSRANISQSLLLPPHQGTTGPPPSRPSRDFTPPINMDRKQGCTNLERQQSLRSIVGPPTPPPRAAKSRSTTTQSHSRTTYIPTTVETFELPIALAPGLACKHKTLPPPPPIEVAIPPPASASSWHKAASSSSTYTTPVGRIDEDAESFQEILKWR